MTDFIVNKPKLQTGERFQVYKFEYLQDMTDHIYYCRFDEELRQQILEHKESLFSKPYNYTLVGHIQKENQLVESHPLAHTIQQEIAKHATNYFSFFNPSPVTSIIQQDHSGLAIWLNEMKATEFNPVHKHGGIISWVAYIDVPEEIRQESEDTSQVENVKGCITILSERTTESMHFNPRSGDILMFSAKQRHLVSPFYSDNTRITMAGNIWGLHHE